MTGLGAALARWHWRHWPVLVKLVAVLLVPALAAMVVGVLRIVDQASAAPDYQRISQIADVQLQLGELIGAVQRERDLAAVFVATGRAGEREPLTRQFDVVQTRTEVVRAAAEQVDDLASTGYRTVLDQLRGLRPLRESTAGGTESAEVVVTEYGAVIDPLIALDAALVRKLDEVAVADDAAAVHALMVSREQVSRQHAVVSAALPANRIRPAQLDQVRAAAVRLGAEQQAFSTALEPAQRSGYVSRALGEAEQVRQRLLQLVIDLGEQNKPLNISPDDWQERTAAALGDLAGVENELRQRIDQTALQLRDDARSAAGWNAIILIFVLVLGVVVAVTLAQSMLGPLGVLRRTALDVAGRRLPAAMARVRAGAEPEQAVEPVAVSTREEIGQVARAFDQVHHQALRLADEQAQLRTHVNDIFVSLSRRSQGLVERQLQLIDRLESNEQDPEALDNLFHLDHLATRMRRNSDNLLVLAGAETTKRSSRPVRLVDVLRAAVSEVEQYRRVVLRQPPGVLVLGRAAGDLVHLLAELLDNATQFSPPDTHVTVSAQVDQDGEVVIEVLDRGVGMSGPERAEANQRLAGTPMVDASVSRRMGLFVVGRLAVRHGIMVRLRAGADDIGVCASVRTPSRLVRPVPESGLPGAAGIAGTSSANDGPVLEPALPGAGGPGTDGLMADVLGADGPRPGGLRPGGLRPGGSTTGGTVEPGSRASPGHRNGRSLLTGPLINGAGTRPPGTPDRPGSPLPRRSADELPHRSADELPRRGADAVPRQAGDRPAPVGRPPRPPVPPSPPSSIPSAGSGGDLFRPSPPGGVAAPAGARPGAPLQHSTPIFDDVATAWFREHHAVPVRWTAADPPDQAADEPASAASDADQPTAQAPVGPAAEAGQVTPAVDVCTDDSALPAETAATDTDVLDATADAGPAADVVGPPADLPQDDWGPGDEGWRAAQALVGPMRSAEVTVAGLPRRMPRALLVPGAAGGADPAPPGSAPTRSAELVRDRLANYQQGLRDGRHLRGSRDRDEGGSHQQQDAEEEMQ